MAKSFPILGQNCHAKNPALKSLKALLYELFSQISFKWLLISAYFNIPDSLLDYLFLIERWYFHKCVNDWHVYSLIPSWRLNPALRRPLRFSGNSLNFRLWDSLTIMVWTLRICYGQWAARFWGRNKATELLPSKVKQHKSDSYCFH